MDLGAFLQQYPPQPPRRSSGDADENRKLTSADGVRSLGKPPAEADERRVHEHSGARGCHLWVMDAGGIPYVLERAAVAATLKSGVVKHTNLTGGEMAACGG